MSIEVFSHLMGNVDPEEIYYADTSFLIAALAGDQTNPNDLQAQSLMQNIQKSALVVTCADVAVREIYSVYRKSNLKAYRKSLPKAKAGISDKQIEEIYPGIFDDISANVMQVRKAMTEAPAILCFSAGFTPDAYDTAVRSVNSVSQIEFQDMMHLMAMKSNDLHYMLTMDSDFLKISDPSFTVCVPDSYLQSKKKSTTGTFIVPDCR